MGERDHSDLQGQLMLLLNQRQYEESFIARPELRVLVSEERFRVPDVCLLRAGGVREQIARTPPLVCIEVLSPEDTMSGTMARMRDFLAMGVAEVWVVDPGRRTVSVCAGLTVVVRSEGAVRVPGTPVTVALEEIFCVLDEG